MRKVSRKLAEPDVPDDAGTVTSASVGLGWSDCDTDGGPGVGNVVHTDTFHTGRPLRNGGLSQVTSICLSSRDLLCSSEK